MLDSSEQIQRIREEMQWTSQAIEYIYKNCDEESEFFEMISDAWLLFNQARRGMENLLQMIELSQLDQDKKI